MEQAVRAGAQKRGGTRRPLSLDLADWETVALSTGPQFLHVIQRSRARLGEGQLRTLLRAIHIRASLTFVPPRAIVRMSPAGVWAGPFPPLPRKEGHS